MGPMLIPTLLCPKAWEGMSGNETTRFCSYCKKHVHNLEAMTVSERLALLSSPAASICARYKVAIRRPAKGKKESYMRHLLKYGAGVALTSSVLVVLWEMYAENEKRIFYRAVAGRPHEYAYSHTGCGWPIDDPPEVFYEEYEVVTLGITIPFPDPAKAIRARPGGPTQASPHIDLDLDPVEINKLLQPARPTAIEFKAGTPVKTKKVR